MCGSPNLQRSPVACLQETPPEELCRVYTWLHPILLRCSSTLGFSPTPWVSRCPLVLPGSGAVTAIWIPDTHLARPLVLKVVLDPAQRS